MRPQRGVLLDTHVLLWALIDSPLLSKRVRRVLQSEVPLYFSSLSIAETVIKTQIGRLHTPPNLTEHLLGLGMRELSFDAASAEGISRFPGLARHDPFDQMLVAQAATHKLILETADRKLLTLGLPTIRDATSEEG
jgi:PIN domain nuclease of toxin-antitoxin system